MSSFCFIALVTWSFTFELDKSVIAPGEIKPLGKPIIVQNRFEGKILKSGTADELAADEQVRKVYLGQNFELRK